MATVFRSPLFTPRGSPSASRAPHTAQADVWSNRLLTLVQSAPRPFHQTEWPNPFNPNTRFPLEDRTDADGTEFWLLKDQFFGGAGQPPTYQPPPNPLGYRFAIDLRTFTDPTEFWLLAPAAQAPFSQTQWPNPLSARGAIDGRSSIESTPFWLLAPAAQAPFSQTDWPNPAQRPWIAENRTEMDGSEFWLLKDTFFGQAGQPPSPTPAASQRIAPFPIDLRTWTQNHLLDTLAPVSSTPFAPIDWPNPFSAQTRVPLENRTQADGTEFWLLKDQFFGAAGQPPTIWPQPNPRGYLFPVDGRTWLQSHTLNTLAPQAQPGNLDDWPNPRGYTYPISLRTDAFFTRLPGKDKIFGGAGQPVTIWPQPNPLGYRYPIELRTGFSAYATRMPTGIPQVQRFFANAFATNVQQDVLAIYDIPQTAIGMRASQNHVDALIVMDDPLAWIQDDWNEFGQ